MKRKTNSQEKALNYAFLLLKFRPRSEAEIFKRLKMKMFQEPLIKATISFLKEKNFINDELFARGWVEFRVKKPLGLRRIKEELKLKGVDEQIVERELRRIKENFPEKEIVSRIAVDKFQKLKGIEPDKAKQRIYGYLMRRGFSPSVIIDSVKQL